MPTGNEAKCDCASMNGQMCYPCLVKDYYAISADNFRLIHENQSLRAERDKWEKLAKERNPNSWRNLVQKRYGIEDIYER
jgi:hypothetical protein